MLPLNYPLVFFTLRILKQATGVEPADKTVRSDGSVEDLALRNVIVQLQALVKISSLEEGHRIIKTSFEQKTYKTYVFEND